MEPLRLPEFKSERPTEPLWQRTPVIVVALLAIFPLGLVLAWRRPGWSAKTKWIITSAIALVVIVSAAAGGSTGAKTPLTTPNAAPTVVETETPEPTLTPTPTPTHTFEAYTPPPVDAVPVEYVAVRRVIDGDTAEVSMSDGSTERVRFIGVDSPESSTSLGPKATAYTKTLLSVGRGVYLETDVEQRDRYGRLLAYVWLSKPSTADDEDVIRARMVNSLLLLKGWAQLLTIAPNVSYVDHFTTFQTEARDAKLGIWKPATTAAPPKKNPPSGGGGGNCDPSYPTVCIPSPPPDLDCGEISYRRFQVVGDDPHGFDADDDGIGCESG